MAIGKIEVFEKNGENEYLVAEENKVKGIPLLDKVTEELKVNGTGAADTSNGNLLYYIINKQKTCFFIYL